MKTRQSFFAAQEQALTLNPASSRGYKLEDVLKHHFFFLLVPTGNCFFPRDSKLFFPTGTHASSRSYKLGNCLKNRFLFLLVPTGNWFLPTGKPVLKKVVKFMSQLLKYIIKVCLFVC